MKEFNKKCVPKRKYFQILKNRIEHVVEEIKMIWKNIYRLIPEDEQKEEVETDEQEHQELDNTEDIYDGKSFPQHE